MKNRITFLFYYLNTKSTNMRKLLFISLAFLIDRFLFNELSDSWVIKLNGNLDDELSQLLLNQNFKILNKVGSLNGYYHVRPHSNSLTRSRRSNNSLQESEDLISAHPLVESFSREKVLSRNRRENIFYETPNVTENPNGRKSLFNDLTDSKWSKMWYLNRHSVFHSDLPDLNVTVVWQLGFTGQGVKVCFLDDGLEWNHTDLFKNYVGEISYLLGREKGGGCGMIMLSLNNYIYTTMFKDLIFKKNVSC